MDKTTIEQIEEEALNNLVGKARLYKKGLVLSASFYNEMKGVLTMARNSIEILAGDNNASYQEMQEALRFLGKIWQKHIDEETTIEEEANSFIEVYQYYNSEF